MSKNILGAAFVCTDPASKMLRCGIQPDSTVDASLHPSRWQAPRTALIIRASLTDETNAPAPQSPFSAHRQKHWTHRSGNSTTLDTYSCVRPYAYAFDFRTTDPTNFLRAIVQCVDQIALLQSLDRPQTTSRLAQGSRRKAYDIVGPQITERPGNRPSNAEWQTSRGLHSVINRHRHIAAARH